MGEIGGDRVTEAILFIIAAWGWYCLVEFSEGAPLAGFILIPTLMPFVVVLTLVRRACSFALCWLNEAFLFAADLEQGK